MPVGSQNGDPNASSASSTAKSSAKTAQPSAKPPEWDAIREDVGEMAGAAVEQGRRFIDSARDQATTYVDRRKDDAAQSVGDLAQSLRDACAGFEDRPNIRAFVDSAAEGLDQLADTIRERSFNEIFEDVEAVMRRRPMAVAAATMTAGFLIARFIKSSADGIREAEEQRRHGEGLRSRNGERSGGGRHSRAQAAPGSPYAGQSRG